MGSYGRLAGFETPVSIGSQMSLFKQDRAVIE